MGVMVSLENDLTIMIFETIIVDSSYLPFLNFISQKTVSLEFQFKRGIHIFLVGRNYCVD